MKNKMIVPLILVILVIAGIVGFILMNKNSKLTNQNPPTNNSTTPQNNSQTVEGTLKSLLTGGKSVKCTYSNQAEEAKIEGIVYVANNKMRSDFTSSTPQGPNTGHIIVDGKFSYFWSDGSKQGMKISMEGAISITPTQDQGASLDKAEKFNCENWNVDNSLLTLPNNVTFSTFVMPTIPASGNNQCAACDNVPEGEARTACKTALKCE